MNAKKVCHSLPTILPELKFCDSRVSDKGKGCGSTSFPDLMQSVMKSNGTTGIPSFTAVLPLYDDKARSESPVTRKFVYKKENRYFVNGACNTEIYKFQQNIAVAAQAFPNRRCILIDC